MGVTATAVRQRLARLTSTRTRRPDRGQSRARGRPSHRYSLDRKRTPRGGSQLRRSGSGTLAGGPRDQGSRSAKRPAPAVGKVGGRNVCQPQYRRTSPPSGCSRWPTLMSGTTTCRFRSKERRSCPVLTAWACPYPTLAEQDRGICAMEKMVFSGVGRREGEAERVPAGWQHLLPV